MSDCDKLKNIAESKYQLVDPYLSNLEKCKNFETNADDIWIITYPKSGTTWVQELVYVMFNGCNYGEKGSSPIDERIPFFEFSKSGPDSLKQMQAPRILKSHLPKCLLPDEIENKSKVIYVARNPRDVCVSYFHFTAKRKFKTFEGSFKDFMKAFLDANVLYGPWWEHIDSYFDCKNIHFIYYEDLQTKPMETIKALAKFLGKEFSDDEFNEINKFCSFENMKANPSTNYQWMKEIGFKEGFEFMRKGQIGDWINHFDKEMAQEFDETISKLLKNKYNFNYGLEKDDFERFLADKENKYN